MTRSRPPVPTGRPAEFARSGAPEAVAAPRPEFRAGRLRPRPDRPGAGPSTVLGARLRPVGVGVRGGSIDCAAATPPAGAPPAARGAQVDGRAFAADLLYIAVPCRIAPSIMTATSGLSRTGSRRAGRPARRRAGSQRATCRRRKPADRGPACSVGAHAGVGDHRHPGVRRTHTGCGRQPACRGGFRRGGDPRRGAEQPAWPRLGRMALAARGVRPGTPLAAGRAVAAGMDRRIAAGVLALAVIVAWVAVGSRGRKAGS